MKRNPALLLFCCVLAFSAGSQALQAQTVVGIHGGLSRTTLGGSDLRDYGQRTGLSAGAFVDLSLSDHFGLRVGLGFSGKGSKTEDELDFGEIIIADEKIGVGYVEVPLLMRLRVNPEQRVVAHALLGPAVAFRVSCDWKLESPQLELDFGCGDTGLEVRDTDVGAMGGLGIQASLGGRVSFLAETVYTLGLRTLSESGTGVKNRAFSVTVGFVFEIG